MIIFTTPPSYPLKFLPSLFFRIPHSDFKLLKSVICSLSSVFCRLYHELSAMSLVPSFRIPNSPFPFSPSYPLNFSPSFFSAFRLQTSKICHLFSVFRHLFSVICCLYFAKVFLMAAAISRLNFSMVRLCAKTNPLYVLSAADS